MIKKFLLSFGLICALLCPCAAWAQIGTPTSIGKAISTTSTIAITTTAQVSAGNLVVVVTGTTGGTVHTVASVSDGTNSYSQAKALVFNSSNSGCEVWYFYYSGTLANSSTITITWNDSPTAGGAAAMQISGLSSTPLDSGGAASAQGSSSTSSVTSNTLAQANEILIGASCAAGSNALNYSANSPFTNLFTQVGTNTGSFRGLGVDYDIVAATTAVTYTGSLGNTDGWAALVVPFKQASAAATCTVPLTGAGPC